MTSGNVSDEPIAYEDDDALERLAPIADLVVTHDRPIQTRVDDSVLRVAGGRPLPLRRSRGAVPSMLALPVPAGRHVLACGAELKSTFCLARGRRAWVSHHIGDLKTAETLASFQEGVRHFERLFAVTPEVVAHDLHPDYLSTTLRARARGRRARRRPAPPRPPRGLPGRARRAGPGRRRDLRRDRPGHRRHGVGRRDPRRRPARLRARRPPVAGPAPGRRPGRARAVADGVRVAEGRRRRAAAGRDRPRALARRRRAWRRAAWPPRSRPRSAGSSTP